VRYVVKVMLVTEFVQSANICESPLWWILEIQR